VSWIETIVCVVAVAIATAGHAQPPAPAPAPESTAPAAAPAPTFVPVSEIPAMTEKLQQEIRRLEGTAVVEPTVEVIAGELPSIHEETARLLGEASRVLDGSPSLEQLRELQTKLEGRLSALAPKRRILASRAGALEKSLKELDAIRERWTLTVDNARETRAPAQVIDAARANLDRIGTAATNVRNRRNSVLTLLTAVSNEEVESTSAIERISSARVELRSRLFEPDARPLWSAVVGANPGDALRLFRDNVVGEYEAFVAFSSGHWRELASMAITFVLLFILARTIGTRLRRKIETDRLDSSASVFGRPVSVALLGTGLIAPGAIPFAPEIARNAFGIVLVLPVLRLIAPAIPEANRGVLGAVVSFYLVDQVRDLISPLEIIERCVFAAETAAAVGLIAFMLRPSRMPRLPRSDAVLRALGVALRVALVALGIATLANVTGYVAFAKLLGGGVLRSVYLALIAFAVYRIGTTLASLLFRSNRLKWARSVHERSARIEGWTVRSVAIGSVSFWAVGALESFGLREFAFTAVTDLLQAPIEVGTVSISFGSVLAFPLTIVVALFLSHAIRTLLDEDVFTRVSLRRGVGNAISTTIHYGLLLGGFFFALGAAGIDLSKFALLAGALGVGIGFGLQNVVNNFVSGLILLYERPVQVGDNIEIGGLLGEVRRIGIRASTIRTFQGAEVIIPNGNLLSDQLVNWTLSDRHRRVEIPVGVAYGNRPANVIEVLRRVLDREERILQFPEPMILFKGFGDSSLDFELRFWARDYLTWLTLASDVASAIYDELHEAGITIPFPQRDLHLKSVDPGVAENLRRSETE